ncbi:hypothetical protein [Shimia sp. SDUM112013]|uniref:hypothetical protein n=1 Tax=Shimia sp. SDUM112013 TaxID=3136160 RepID=UPI0032EEBF1A
MSVNLNPLLDWELVRRKRQVDPVLNEVCQDLQTLEEELASLSNNTSETAAPQIRDLKTTLDALRTEILIRIAE